MKYRSEATSASEPSVTLRAADCETLALLRILELGTQEVADGKVKPPGEVIARLRGRIPATAGRDGLREQLLGGGASAPAGMAEASYFKGLRARVQSGD